MTNQPERILVVDDEEIVRRLLFQRLSREGYWLEKASSADQALDKLRSNTVDLVVLDINMPGKSGAELLPEIRARYPDTMVIMVTAITDTNIAIQCMKQGAYDYLTKPFSLDEVILSIGRALEKRKLELENRDYRQHLERKVEKQAEKIRASLLNTVMALVYALEAKDEYTNGHSQRVAEMSVAIAVKLGWLQPDIEKIRLAGLIHDIGKIGVRKSVLEKPGRLTEAEYQHIKYHCEIGERILMPVMETEVILKMVRHHHERYDGTGYPDRLIGEQIPLGARILAVADSYDAMTSERLYRKAMSVETAYAEIEHGQGTQFDPVVADAFLRIRKYAYGALLHQEEHSLAMY